MHFDSDENNALFAFYWLANSLGLIQVQLSYVIDGSIIGYRNNHLVNEDVASLSSVTGQISEMPANNSNESGFCGELVVRFVPSQVPSHALKWSQVKRRRFTEMKVDGWTLTLVVFVVWKAPHYKTKRIWWSFITCSVCCIPCAAYRMHNNSTRTV